MGSTYINKFVIRFSARTEKRISGALLVPKSLKVLNDDAETLFVTLNDITKGVTYASICHDETTPYDCYPLCWQCHYELQFIHQSEVAIQGGCT